MGNGASSLPFTAGAELTAEFTYSQNLHWTKVQEGVSNGADAKSVTIFSLDKTTGARHAEDASREVKNLKMWKHPNVLAFIDAQDSEAGCFLVTEAAIPLGLWLKRRRVGEDACETAIIWGLYSLLQGVSFLHSRGMVHGAISVDTVMVTPGGDWKLAGLHCCGKAEEAASSGSWMQRHRNAVSCIFRSPFAAAASSSAAAVQALDVWSVAAIAALAFNPQSTGHLAGSDAAALAKVPLTSLPSQLRSLVAGALSCGRQPPRVTIKALLACPAFKHPVVGALLFLDSLALKEPLAKQKFFKALPKLLPRMPAGMREHKVLPALMTALEFGAAGGGGTVVLAPILAIGKELSEARYSSVIVPCVVRLFASPDRATRIQLLHYMDQYVGAMSTKVLNGDVFRHALSGFGDENPLLREATIKAAATMAPHLSAANLSTTLSHLGRCLGDQVARNRVNTIVAVCAMAPHLQEEKRVSTLCSFFAKALRDSKPAVRCKALLGMRHAVRTDQVPLQVAAGQFLPAAAKQCFAASPSVREAALGMVQAATSALEAHVASTAPPPGAAAQEVAGQTTPPLPEAPAPPLKAAAAVPSGHLAQAEQQQSVQAGVGAGDGEDDFWSGLTAEAVEPPPTKQPPPASLHSKPTRSTPLAAPTLASAAGRADADGWDDDGWEALDPLPAAAPAHSKPAGAPQPVGLAALTASMAAAEGTVPKPLPASGGLKAPTAQAGVPTAPPAAPGARLSVKAQRIPMTQSADDGWDDW